MLDKNTEVDDEDEQFAIGIVFGDEALDDADELDEISEEVMAPELKSEGMVDPTEVL